MIDWLLTPLSGAAVHQIEPWAYWHARAMVLAWGVLLPLGALLARFFKVLPGQDWPRVLDRKLWWHGHRGLQWAGIALMTAGAALAWGRGAGASPLALWHAVLGWLLCAAGWLQVAASQARGTKGGPTSAQTAGDHYDMTPRRVRFERLHKGVGWGAIGLAVVAIGLGLVLADAPLWMTVALVLWWGVLAAAFTLLQRSGRCIDTYQAIWGPDPAHPGNRRAPVGWGVRRPLG